MATTQKKINDFLLTYEDKKAEIQSDIKKAELKKSEIEVELLELYSKRKKLIAKYEAYNE